MWVNRNDKNPEYDGAVKVFGTVNKGSEHETKTKFNTHWDESRGVFTDSDGEDLTGIDEGVEYWWDFSQVADPY